MGQSIKKRIPEKTEGINNYSEILKYYKAHQILKNKYWDLYDLVAKNILKNIKINGGEVLDVACGYGGLVSGLRGNCIDFEYVGIDISKAMIQIGKKYYSDSKTKFVLMPANKMEFRNESFDIVLCKDSFHHFNNPVVVLKEMYRVLKKGGTIYSMDLMRDAPDEVIFQITQLASELNIENAFAYLESHSASYTIMEMKSIIKKAGIKNYKISVPKITRNFLGDYKLKDEDYLSASNYLRDKWVLVIKK